MKNFSKLSLIAGALLMTLLLAGCKQIKTVNSIEQVGDDPYLFVMENHFEYDLDEVIENDINSNNKLLVYVTGKIGHGLMKADTASLYKNSDFGCTSFQVKKKDGDGYWYGRNYDFFKDPTMVVINKPEEGFASISTCDLMQLGLGFDKLPTSFKNKMICLAGVYAPMDGINEKGLCTSIMALPHQAGHQNTGKHKVGTSIIMRLWLDRCATVDEAVELLAKYDLCHDIEAGSGYHYMVADANGDCAIIELDKDDAWKTIVLRKPAGSNYFHITNHLLNPKHVTTEPDPTVGNPDSKSWWRYETVNNYMIENNGMLSLEGMQKGLEMVRWVDLALPGGEVEDTQWSNVYDQTNIVLYHRNWNSYDKTYIFTLQDSH